MARTDKERYEGAIGYIEKNIGRSLARDIKQKTNSAAAGKAISLKGASYWRSGSDGQHWAVRALLLCQQAFLVGPGADPIVKASNSSAAATAMTFFRGKSETDIREAILSYTQDPGRSRDKLLRIAKSTNATAGDFVFATRTRKDQSLGPNPVCFNAVRLWLFNAGFVSLKWLASTGFDLDANTGNKILGKGRVVELAQLGSMPGGYMFNFHARGYESLCHWGISLGGGLAAGSNTASNHDDADAPVEFKKGNTVYGWFTLTSSYEVCKHKYRIEKRDPAGWAAGKAREVEELVIRQIDPTQIQTFF